MAHIFPYLRVCICDYLAVNREMDYKTENKHTKTKQNKTQHPAHEQTSEVLSKFISLLKTATKPIFAGA